VRARLRPVLCTVLIVLALLPVGRADAGTSASGTAGTTESARFFRDTLPPPGGVVPQTRVLRERFVTLDLALMRRVLGDAAGDPGRKVAFRLFDDVTIETTGEFEHRPTGFSWSGRGTNADGADEIVVFAAQDAHLVSLAEGDGAYAQFWSGSKRYSLQSLGGAFHVIYELDVAALNGADEGTHGPAEADHDQGESPLEALGTPNGVTSAGSRVTIASAVTHTVDVLVVYTQAALAARPAIGAWIDTQIDLANQANSTSGLPFRFRKAAQAQVSYAETATGIGTDLDNLRGAGDGVLDGVHPLRDDNGGDVVVMLGRGWSPPAPQGSNACGKGVVMNSVSSSFAPHAFSVVDVADGCAMTFAHEIGHNMALRHDWANSDGNGSPFRYNHGHASVPGNFRTMMAYRPGECAAGCPRIPNWSDPDVSHNGFPTGVADAPTTAQPADNARAISQTSPTVSQFRSLDSIGGSGGTDSPAVVSWGLNRLDVFQRGPAGTLLHKWWDGSAWSAWEDLGGGLNGGPDVASWGANRLDVFIRGTDNALHHKAWTGSGWTGWTNLGGTITADPAAVSRGPGLIDVFVRGTDGGLWHKWYSGGWSSGFSGHGGTLNSSPDVASWGGNRLDVFTRGTDNALWHKWWNGASWSAWASLGGAIGGGPGAVSWGANRVDVVVRGVSGGLWHTYWNGSSWVGYYPLKPDGTVASDPDLASWTAGRLDAVYRHVDGTIHRYWN
jgi:hypothetical protein